RGEEICSAQAAVFASCFDPLTVGAISGSARGLRDTTNLDKAESKIKAPCAVQGFSRFSPCATDVIRWRELFCDVPGSSLGKRSHRVSRRSHQKPEQARQGRLLCLPPCR